MRKKPEEGALHTFLFSTFMKIICSQLLQRSAKCHSGSQHSVVWFFVFFYTFPCKFPVHLLDWTSISTPSNYPVLFFFFFLSNKWLFVAKREIHCKSSPFLFYKNIYPGTTHFTECLDQQMYCWSNSGWSNQCHSLYYLPLESSKRDICMKI